MTKAIDGVFLDNFFFHLRECIPLDKSSSNLWLLKVLAAEH